MVKIDGKQFRKAFGKRLRGARLLAGHETARDFSKIIDVFENTYTRWERGEVPPSVEQIIIMCWHLQITPNDLLWPRLRPGEHATSDQMAALGINESD